MIRHILNNAHPLVISAKKKYNEETTEIVSTPHFLFLSEDFARLYNETFLTRQSELLRLLPNTI